MFLAIINDTYSEVKEDLATRESEFDLGAFLKKGYGNMLTKLNLKKDRLKDIADALDTADLDNVSFGYHAFYFILKGNSR